MGFNKFCFEEAFGAPLIEFLKFWNAPRKLMILAFKRRMIEDQIDHNLRVSKNDLSKHLGWLSFACMGVGVMVATGVFSFMPYIYSSITGPSIILSLIIASLTSILSALLYSEFSVEYPVVGGGFVYVLNTFGELPAILCAVNLVLDYLFGSAAVARNFSLYISQSINKDRNIFQIQVGFQADALDYLAFVLIILLTLVLIWSTKIFDEGNIYMQAPHVILLVIIIVAAFTQADTSYWAPFFPPVCSPEGPYCPEDGSTPGKEYGCVDPSWGTAGARRIVTGAANIFFIFLGYDVISLGAEEAKSPLSVPLGMVGVVVFVTIIYILMAASLIMLYPLSGIACQSADIQIAGLAYAFSQRGMAWAKYMVAIGASVGILTSTGIGIYGLSRIFQVFAREGVIPPFIGIVNSYTLTPIFAIAISGVATAVLAFFTSFSTLANMTSIGALVMFWFVAISFLYRRYSPDFEAVYIHNYRHLAIPFRPDVYGHLSVKLRRFILLVHIFLITAFPVVFTVYWNISDKSLPLVVTSVGWFLTTLSLQLTMPIHYQPEKFYIPWYMLPWVPSGSVLANVILMGGFGAVKGDYIRLFVAMGLGVIVYLLYGIHASYWRFYGGMDGNESETEAKTGEGSVL